MKNKRKKIRKREENPFEEERVAADWIKSIETLEKDSPRAKDIYPRVSRWSEKIGKGIVLEIGSGQGVNSTVVSKKARYIGVEPSRMLIEYARRSYLRRGAQFCIGNAYDLPVRSSSVDGVLLLAVLFHLKSLNDAVKEIARVLKAEGRFYIVTANPAAYVVWESFFARHESIRKEGRKSKEGLEQLHGIYRRAFFTSTH